MGKSSKPNFPSPPTFQADPFLEKTQAGLFETGEALRTGGFTDPDNPVVGFLNDLVTTNPEASQQAFQLASRDVTDLRDRAQQDILNQLEANNQLTSSTSVNRLSDLNEAFSADIADIATNIHLADVERAFSNTSALFGVGLQTLDSVGQRGLSNQSQVNSFNQTRFGQEVALESERFNRQQANEASKAKTVGFFTGPVGGALFGGIDSGSTGSQAGLQGGLQGVQFATSLAGAFGGGGFGGSGNAGGLGGTQDLGLNERLLLQQQRANLGVA